MEYNLEFQFKVFDILENLNETKPDYYTVTDVFNEYTKTKTIDEKYKPILRKRIRSVLIKLSIIDKVEKLEEVSEKKVFLYKFKLKKNE